MFWKWTKRECKWIGMLLLCIFCCAMGMKSGEAEQAMLYVDQKIIVIDAGHGGWDPGKVSAIGTKEKDINLQIAEKLKLYLESGGATVFLTRVEDVALAEEKNKDLAERIAVSEGADLLLSLHQNSFPQASVSGAQVFYHKESEAAQCLAVKIQEALQSIVEGENHRQAKANEGYYLLRETSVPSVIVECGFLSNQEEETLLQEDAYQSRLAWAIYKGILDYFEEEALL